MTEYQGWTNQATWAVNLWLSNDADSYHTIRAEVRGATPIHAGDMIEAFVEARLDDADITGLFADLVRISLDSVNWEEIGASFTEE